MLFLPIECECFHYFLKILLFNVHPIIIYDRFAVDLILKLDHFFIAYHRFKSRQIAVYELSEFICS